MTTSLGVLYLYIVRYTKKTNDCSLTIKEESDFDFVFLYYQFDEGANGANTFTFGLAVKPSKRLYV